MTTHNGGREKCAYCGQDIYGGPGVWHIEGGYEVCPAEGHPFHEPFYSGGST